MPAALQMKLIHRSEGRVQDLLVRRFTELRRRLWAFNTEVAWFASGEGAMMWRELGLEGLASVCFEVSQMAKEMHGGGLIAADAGALAWMLMHEA